MKYRKKFKAKIYKIKALRITNIEFLCTNLTL